MGRLIRWIHSDCFANIRLRRGLLFCDARGEVADCDDCPFYRSRQENNALLLQHNGTLDMEGIIKNYGKRREG